jgi:hypothetical protein
MHAVTTPLRRKILKKTPSGGNRIPFFFIFSKVPNFGKDKKKEEIKMERGFSG